MGDEIKRLTIPPYILSINKHHITSEANAINLAIAAGIFHDFLDEEELIQTVSGRMYSSKWDFTLNDSKSIDVHSSLMEIDGSLESENLYALIEAKNKLNDDFLIRQVYYPYREFYQRFGTKKLIRNIFMIYNAGIYILLEYEFPEIGNMLSIKQLKKSYYILGDLINKQDAKNILDRTNAYDRNITFPQANDLFKVLNILELISNDIDDEVTAESIAKYYNLNKRQGNYYKTALCYIGFITTDQKAVITELGYKYLKSNFKEKIEIILEFCATDFVFRAALKNCLLDKLEFNNNDYLELFDKYKIEYNNTTRNRRLSTVKAWISWLKNIVS